MNLVTDRERLSAYGRYPVLRCRIRFLCSVCIQDARLMNGFKYMCELD